MCVAQMFHARSMACALLAMLALICGTSAASLPASPPITVLLISVDGLKPEAVLNAHAHGLTLPNLAQITRDGVYSSGVHGVLPTVTYPSHTTLLTGVSPAKHGIYANTTFDPFNKNSQGWYWYAEDVKVPTLWDAAHKAGLTTANVYWPVSVGAGIDYNLPQIWRSGMPDDLKLQRGLSTPGLEAELVATLGRYPGGMEETVDADEVRTRFAVKILELKHPAFMTVYLTGLDTEQHASGPFSAKLDCGTGKARCTRRTVAECGRKGRAGTRLYLRRLGPWICTRTARCEPLCGISSSRTPHT